MIRKIELPKILREISLHELERIDLALEGDWNATMVTVWEKESGLHGWGKKVLKHPHFKPSLELYYRDGWVGIHCYRQKDGQNVFDREKGEKIINFIEKKLSLP